MNSDGQQMVLILRPTTLKTPQVGRSYQHGQVCHGTNRPDYAKKVLVV